jgi:hypothetical protein
MKTCSRKTRNQRGVQREKLNRNLSKQYEVVMMIDKSSLNQFHLVIQAVIAINYRMTMTVMTKVLYFALTLDISIKEMFNFRDLKNEEGMVRIVFILDCHN